MPSTGRPRSKKCCGARGLSSQVTELWAAGQDDAPGLKPLEGLVGAVERGDLAIDAGLAHAARDQLVTWLPKSTMRMDWVGWTVMAGR